MLFPPLTVLSTTEHETIGNKTFIYVKPTICTALAKVDIHNPADAPGLPSATRGMPVALGTAPTPSTKAEGLI